MDTTSTLAEIDSAHFAANLALKNQDFDRYIGHFSDNLKYKQLNGFTIDKETLAKDTRKYFDRIKNYTNDYERQNFSIDKNLFIEKLNQKATVIIRVFIFLSKKWIVEREGIYKWEKFNGHWKIVDVEVISEKVR